jgi:hypothetical protein
LYYYMWLYYYPNWPIKFSTKEYRKVKLLWSYNDLTSKFLHKLNLAYQSQLSWKLSHLISPWPSINLWLVLRCIILIDDLWWPSTIMTIHTKISPEILTMIDDVPWKWKITILHVLIAQIVVYCVNSTKIRRKKKQLWRYLFSLVLVEHVPIKPLSQPWGQERS